MTRNDKEDNDNEGERVLIFLIIGIFLLIDDKII